MIYEQYLQKYGFYHTGKDAGCIKHKCVYICKKCSIATYVAALYNCNIAIARH